MASENVIRQPSEGFVCQRDHKIPSDRSLSCVRWNETKGPRPMPRQALSHMRPLQYFNKCWSYPDCERGHLCYYAHTDEELSLWNKQLKQERSNCKKYSSISFE